MEIKKVQDAEVEGKKVLLRVDFNVGVENDTVKEKFKIQSAKETLDYLLAMNAKVAMLSWLGRPGGKKDPAFSLSPIKDDAEYILGHKIRFVPDCVGEEVVKAMDDLLEGEVALLENVRFYSEEGDIEAGKDYDPEFAKKLAQGFDFFVNDAFSVTHRDQASVTGVAKFLPSYAGFNLQKEVEEMEKIKNDPEHPAVAIIGGAKIETKLPVIKFFESTYDNVLVGGKIGSEAESEDIKFSDKVIMPLDYSGEREDIGMETINKFKEIISGAKTIVWNGPLGKFEDPKFSLGTDEIMKAILESDAYAVVGGGETLEVLEKYNAMKKVGFVSTGGGAMLEYLGGGKMPGIEVLA